MSARQTDLWVFRDGKKSVSGKQLLQELTASVGHLRQVPGDGNAQLTSLILAGELESAVADSNAPTTAYFAALTDAIAGIAFGSNLLQLRRLAVTIAGQPVPDRLTLSPPEGFTYYALHPLHFGQLARAAVRQAGPVAIVGIRTIGTTLSAVAAAALRAVGHAVERITVRPTGHPYDRVTQFSGTQLAWIARQRACSASFLVVDEGPGRSGSTFLSVAEALLSAGVAREKVTLVGSREPDPDQLCARDAIARWSSFKFVVATPSTYARFANHIYAGGGDWRKKLLPPGAPWPACWPQTERLKFLSRDRKRLFKFEGLGRIGNIVRNRAHRLFEASFGPDFEDAGDGFTSYTVAGAPLSTRHISTEVLERVAQYCAFRSREFALTDERPDRLGEALRFNAQLEFGVEIALDEEYFHPRNLILADGRMQPYEWIQGADGPLLKVDGSTHGDDHFFPGPTDIAWDIAGFAIEWNLDPGGLEWLVRRFHQLTGDHVRKRLPLFMFAYTMVRLATWKMALSTVLGSAEEQRVREAYALYRRLAEQQLPGFCNQSRRSAVGQAPQLAA